MRVSLNRKSIQRDFVALASTILFAVVLLSSWFSWKIFNNHSESVIDKLHTQAARLERTFAERMDYSSYLMEYLNTRIIENGPEDLPFIDELLSSFRLNTEVNDKIAWNMFSWVNNHSELVVNSEIGIVSPTTLRANDYILQAKERPWEIMLGKPTYSKISKEWILPTSMGATDEQGAFLGATVFGVNLGSLRRIMELSLNVQGIKFVLVDEELQQIVESEDNFITENSRILDNLRTIDFNKKPEGISSYYSLLHDSDGFSVYHRLTKYPYIIVVNFDKKLSRQEVWDSLFSRVIELSIIGAIVVLMLAALYRRIINPIITLSNTAEELTSGNSNVEIPKKSPYEISVLARQLQDVQRYVQKINKIDKELMEAKKEADRANQAKTDFLANMSHELRTPLNAVIGYSEIMKAEILGPVLNKKYLEYAGDIHSSGAHLLSIINDILDISKAESGKFEIDESTIDVQSTINKCLKIIAERARNKNIVIATKIPDNLPKLHADYLRVKQIIINLLSNAIKFSNESSKVTIRVEIRRDGLYIAVEDNGIGIAKENISKVLEKFGQVDSSISRKTDGTGIGLWLTKMLVEAHGGTFTLESELGRGTKAIVLFPKNRIARDFSNKDKVLNIANG